LGQIRSVDAKQTSYEPKFVIAWMVGNPEVPHRDRPENPDFTGNREEGARFGG
jgi:hypothetical protein